MQASPLRAWPRLVTRDVGLAIWVRGQVDHDVTRFEGEFGEPVEWAALSAAGDADDRFPGQIGEVGRDQSALVWRDDPLGDADPFAERQQVFEEGSVLRSRRGFPVGLVAIDST
jgi:hypothetical protein